MSDEPRTVWEVGLMPWAALPNTTEIGGFQFVPFQRLSKAVDSVGLRRTLRQAASRYRKNGTNGKDSASLIVRKAGAVEPFSEAEQAEIRDIVNIVAFSCFIENSLGMLARTAENFEYVFLRIPEPILSGGIAYAAGSLVRNNVIVSAGVKKFFHAPDYLHVPMASTPDRTMLSVLTQVYEDLDKRQLRAGVLRALDFTRLAYANTPSFHEKTRIVLLCTAFETLVEVDRGQKAQPIAERIDELLGEELFRSSRAGREGNHTRYGWFFRELYDLRNRIMHGDAVGGADFVFTNPSGTKSKFLIGLDLFKHTLEEHMYSSGVRPNDETRWIRKLGLAQYFDESKD